EGQQRVSRRERHAGPEGWPPGCRGGAGEGCRLEDRIRETRLRHAMITRAGIMLMRMTVLFAGAAILSSPALLRAADPDWKAVEQALGKAGQLMPGDVYRVGMPRTDLSVTVKGVPVKAGFALGSYAAFKPVGDHTMVMGDLVLLDQEVPAVMSALLGGGLEVTAVHNHVNDVSPHVLYMHYGGHGDAVQLAKALRQALAASGTPLGATVAAPAAASG